MPSPQKFRNQQNPQTKSPISSREWLRETKSELKKVVWPSWKQVVNNTLVVIVVMLIFAVFVGAVDAIFKLVISLLFN